MLYEDYLHFKLGTHIFHSTISIPEEFFPLQEPHTSLLYASQNSTSSLRKQVCLSILFLCSGFLAKLCSNPVPKVPLLKYHKQATMQHVRIISYFKKTCLLSIACSSFAASWHIFWLPKYRSQLGGMFSS